MKEAIQTVPPVAITATAFLGVPWQQWVYLLTAVYTFFQIIRLFPKMYGCMVCFRKEGWSCKRTCKGG